MEGGVEVVACDCDILVRLGSANSILVDFGNVEVLAAVHAGKAGDFWLERGGHTQAIEKLDQQRLTLTLL